LAECCLALTEFWGWGLGVEASISTETLVEAGKVEQLEEEEEESKATQVVGGIFPLQATNLGRGRGREKGKGGEGRGEEGGGGRRCGEGRENINELRFIKQVNHCESMRAVQHMASTNNLAR